MLIFLLFSSFCLEFTPAERRASAGSTHRLGESYSLVQKRHDSIAEVKMPKEVLEELGIFSIFLKAMHQAGFGSCLDGMQKMTIFAPTDHAFAHMSADQVEYLLSVDNPFGIHAMMKNHLVLDQIRIHELIDGVHLHTFNTQKDLVLKTSIHSSMKKIGSVTLLPAYVYDHDTVVYSINGLITDEMLQPCEQNMEFSFDDVFDFDYSSPS